MVDIKELQNTLKRMGLDEQEAQIYSVLLFEDSLSLLGLSQKVSIPRTTVYRICERMVAKSLLQWVIKFKSKQVRVVNPKNLNNYTHSFEQKYSEVTEALSELATISTKLPSNILSTQVRYYKGVDGIRQLVWNTLEAKDFIMGYSPWGRDDITGTVFERKYSLEAKRRNIQDLIIMNNSGATKFLNGFNDELNTIQKIRILDIDIPSDVYIYNNIYGIIIQTDKEVAGVEIESAPLATLQKGLFQKLWEQCKTLEDHMNML